MSPPDLRTRETRPRRRAKAPACVALAVVCVIAFSLAARANGAVDAAGPAAPGEKDIRRAEKVLAKLRLLDEARPGRGMKRARSTPCPGKFYLELFIMVADMREGDLKTDLDTAVFLYEAVIRARPSEGTPTLNSGEQRRDIYLPLCLELRGGTVRQFLLAKARLRARWGEAAVAHYRGERGPETSLALSAMRAAREHDSVLAAQALGALKTLEEGVQATRS